jgi:hypothetical protein
MKNMIPDKIYLGVGPIAYDKPDTKVIYAEWVEEPYPGAQNIEYLRKDTLLEWANRLKERWEEPPMSRHSPGCVFMLEQLIKKLNSL